MFVQKNARRKVRAREIAYWAVEEKVDIITPFLQLGCGPHDAYGDADPTVKKENGRSRTG